MSSENKKSAPKIGVMALQGAFIEHIKVLRSLGAETCEVRLPEDLEGLDGLIIPGGESTAIGKLMVNWGLIEPVKAMSGRDKPIWGTCAGMILLAKDIGGLNQPLLGLMDIKVERNAFGSQLESFEADLQVPAFEEIMGAGEGSQPFRGVFIRAPYIEEVGPGASPVASLERNSTSRAAGYNGQQQPIIVAARQGNLLATAFHPELTDDSRFHRLFLKMVEERRGS